METAGVFINFRGGTLWKKELTNMQIVVNWWKKVYISSIRCNHVFWSTWAKPLFGQETLRFRCTVLTCYLYFNGQVTFSLEYSYCCLRLTTRIPDTLSFLIVTLKLSLFNIMFLNSIRSSINFYFKNSVENIKDIWNI